MMETDMRTEERPNRTQKNPMKIEREKKKPGYLGRGIFVNFFWRIEQQHKVDLLCSSSSSSSPAASCASGLLIQTIRARSKQYI